MKIDSRHKRRAGAAIVEMAVMLILMVPVIFYTFSLMDMSFHVVDAQEAVISSTWDFMTAPYGWLTGSDQLVGGGYRGGGIDNQNRVEYADHSSADLAVGGENNCGVAKKHSRPWIEMLWGQGDAYVEKKYSDYQGRNSPCQVSCVRDTEKGGDLNVFGNANVDAIAGVKSYSTEKNTGGRYICWAKGALVNYFIPTSFYKYTGDKALVAKRAERDAALYNNNEFGWILLRNRASIVAGSWNADESSRNSSSVSNGNLKITENLNWQVTGYGRSVFYKRVQDYVDLTQGSGAVAVANAAKTIAIGAYGADLLSHDLAIMAMPSPYIPWVTYTSSSRGSQFKVADYAYTPVSEKKLYNSSGEKYLDEARGKRGIYYLGMKNSR